MLEVILGLIIIVFAMYLIKKSYDIKWVMFSSGILLMASAYVLNKPILPKEMSCGVPIFDIFKVIGNLFTKQLSGPSFNLLLLFGYTAYMKEIGANEKTVLVLSNGLKKIRHKGMLIPIFYLIGNLLCIIIPSSSSLSVMLMATAFPILTRAGMSPLTVAAIIATSATIAPTPLGADNILASESLGMSVTDYVFLYHAKISIPVILIMAFVHFVWQRREDRRDETSVIISPISISDLLDVSNYYVILPMLPLGFMMMFYFTTSINLGIVEVTLLSLMISMGCEIIRFKSVKQASHQLEMFFAGMGTALTTVVIQVVAALTFVEGLKILGIINLIGEWVEHLDAGGLVLTIIFCLVALGVGLLSGSGLAIFYALVELMPAFASKVGLSPIMLTIPMQFVSHLVKSISPVSPTVLIISSIMNIPVSQLIRRTVVPVGIGMILSLILTYVIL